MTLPYPTHFHKWTICRILMNTSLAPHDLKLKKMTLFYAWKITSWFWLQTSSSHGSSVFKDFLRRSSKKYKREKPNPSHNTVQAFKTEEKPKQSNESIKKSQSDTILLNSPSKLGSKVIYDDGSSTTSETQVPTPCPFSELSVPNVTNSQQYSVSPLSLIPSELNLVENSRNRNPIYINQPVSKNKS